MFKKSSRKQDQDQIMIDKQKMKKIQDQEFSNSTLCSLICTFETIFKILQTVESYKPMFQYYDPLKSREMKQVEDLLDQANVQTQLFCTSHQIYVKNWQEYNLPKNLNQDYLKHIINELAKCPQLKPHVQNLIYILNGEYEKVEMFALDTKNSNVEFDYETLAKTIPMVFSQGQEFGANTQKKYENDPDKYEVLAKINVDPASHPLVKKKQLYDGIDFTSPETVQQSSQLKNSKASIATEQIPQSMSLEGKQSMSIEGKQSMSIEVQQNQQLNNPGITTYVESEQQIQLTKNFHYTNIQQTQQSNPQIQDRDASSSDFVNKQGI